MAQIVVAESDKEAEQQIPNERPIQEERDKKHTAEGEAGSEESLADKRPRLEESDVVVPFVVQPKIKNTPISYDASALKDPAVALSLAASVLLPTNKVTFRAEPDLVAIALAVQSALLTVGRIAKLGCHQHDAVERIGRLKSEAEGERSRAEFEAMRAAMESAQAEDEKERAQTADRLRSDTEERANASEELLKLANEALAKVEAELEELRKAKEKADSEASTAFEDGKSAALENYVEETVGRIAKLGCHQHDAVERIGRLKSEAEGERSRAEFEAMRAAMESAQAEDEKERAQTADRLRSDTEERANASEELLKLANEALAKVEAELEELRKAKEKADSEASTAFEAGKSAALENYVEEVFFSREEARSLVESDIAMNCSGERHSHERQGLKKHQPLSRQSRSPQKEKQGWQSVRNRDQEMGRRSSAAVEYYCFVVNSFLVLDLGLDYVYGAKGFRLKGDYLVWVNRELSAVRSKHFQVAGCPLISGH
ncbi:plectin-like [Camellia sinensis]|uniref:plectin-like n=1 Tax=Camellia sinensis TaxID=4442 RepID=UPI0010360AF9|nr:plectin-like [Camellia sinensis]